jgi:hypothetical protein
MAKVRIQSILKFNGDVFVRCDDIIKSLYADLAATTDTKIKNHIREEIELWELYNEDAINHMRK